MGPIPGCPDILLPAFVTSHGATVRLLKKTGWEESAEIAQVMVGKSALRDAVDEVNQFVHASGTKIKCKLLDVERPDLWPTQHALSAAFHKVQADGVEEHLAAVNPAFAGWFASMRLRGSGSWLRANPSIITFRVSPELYRIQLSMRIMAPIPALTGADKKCKCGYRGPQLATGMHFLTGCREVSMSQVRHNAAVRVLGEVCKKIGFQVRSGESANWVRKRPDLRPFDLLYKADPTDKWTGVDLGIADPSRYTLAAQGSKYFKSGQAAKRLENRKKSFFHHIISTYGQLKVPAVPKQIAIEATGGLGVKAAKFVQMLYSEAQHQKRELPSELVSWSAQTFSAHWQQRLSFEITKFTSMAVLFGARAATSADLDSD